MVTMFKLGLRWCLGASLALAVTTAPLLAQRTARPRPTLRRPPPQASALPQTAKMATYLASSAMGLTSITWWDGVVTPDYPHRNKYVAQPVYVDWTRPQLTWWVQWKTTTPGVASALWQVSTMPFPHGTANWQSPPGFRASGKVPNVPPAGVARDFAIDLTKLAPRPTWWSTLQTSTAKQAGGTTVKAAPLPPAPAQGGRRPGRLRLPTRTAPPSPNAAVAAPAPGALALPAALYIRVVPLDAKGQPIGNPSNLGMLTFGPPKPTAPPPKLGLASFGMPEARLVEWTPPQPYAEDVQCWLMATRDFKNPITGDLVYAKGQKVHVCGSKGGDDPLDAIGDALGDFAESFADLAEDVADWAAGVYNGLKKELISTIVSGLKSTIGCGKECQLALATAVDAGLAAMGVPPSIPNFDQMVAQLEEQGVDYLAGAMVSAAASQGVPLPEELAREAVEEFVDQAKQATASSGGSGAPLFVPDPDRTYRPAVLVVEFRNIGAGPTKHTALTIEQVGRTHYSDMVFYAPPLAPGESMRVPLFLTPTDDPEAWRAMLATTDDVLQGGVGVAFQKAEQARQAIAAWKVKYSSGQLTFQAGMTNDVHIAGGPTIKCQAGAPICAP